MRGKIGALVAAVAAAAGAAGAAGWAKRRQDQKELDLEVTGPGAEAAGSDAAGATATSLDAEPPAPAEGAGPSPGATFTATAADDLTAIKGLGKVKAAKLVEAGITTYAQIAAWSDDDIAEVGLRVNTSPGQIKREDWVGQAKALADGSTSVGG